MAFLSAVFKTLRQGILIATRRPPLLKRRRPYFITKRAYAVKITMGDPIEHATGIEKRELLAKQAGNCDPWGLHECTEGTGTKEDPILVKSAYDARLVGCICHEDAVYPCWMWVLEGECKRCECGRWFMLVHREAF